MKTYNGILSISSKMIIPLSFLLCLSLRVPQITYSIQLSASTSVGLLHGWLQINFRRAVVTWRLSNLCVLGNRQPSSSGVHPQWANNLMTNILLTICLLLTSQWIEIISNHFVPNHIFLSDYFRVENEHMYQKWSCSSTAVKWELTCKHLIAFHSLTRMTQDLGQKDWIHGTVREKQL